MSYLTLSRRRPISCRNQSIDLWSKSMGWFLYDIGLRRERVIIIIWISGMMEIFQNELLRVSTLRHLLLYNIFRWSIKGGYSYIIKLLLPRVYQFSLPTFLNLLFTLMQFRISTVDFDTTCPFKTKVPSYWTAKQSTSLYMMGK